MNITNLQTVILSAFIALIGGGLSAMNLNIPGLILVIGGVLGIFSVFAFNIYQFKAKVFPSNLIPWLFFRLRRNNPDLFPDLNETALKKHIALVASHSNFEKAIKNVYLFDGTPFRYQIVVIGKNTKDFDGINDYWDRTPSDLFEKHFEEIYRKEPVSNYWRDWNVIVVKSLNEMPDDLILKKHKWTLY